MALPLVIAAIAGAVLGKIRADQQERQGYKQNQLEALKTQNSPYTGRTGEVVSKPDTMGMMMQGALAGANFGQQLGGGKTKDPEVTAEDIPVKYPMPNESDYQNFGLQLEYLQPSQDLYDPNFGSQNVPAPGNFSLTSEKIKPQGSSDKWIEMSNSKLKRDELPSLNVEEEMKKKDSFSILLMHHGYNF